jgi:glycogen synthase
MDIDLVAPFPPPYGGMGVRFERLAAILEQRGYCCRKIPIRWVAERARWKRLRRAWSFLMPAWQVLRSRAHIIHTVTGSIPNAFAISVILLAGRLARRRVVLSIGGGDFLGFAQCASPRLRWAMRQVFRLADVVVPCNQTIEQALYVLGVAPERVVYISNALPDEIGSRQLETPDAAFLEFCQAHQPVLLFMGAMQKHYGLQDVLSALDLLQEDFPDWGLAIMVKEGGDAWFSRHVMECLETRKLTGQVQVYQSVPWAVGAMPYAQVLIRATNVSDGDSRAVREALAVGLPVVASDVGHRPPGVALYRAGDVTDLVRAIKESLEGGRHQTEYLNAEGEENLRQYEALYNNLISKGMQQAKP